MPLPENSWMEDFLQHIQPIPVGENDRTEPLSIHLAGSTKDLRAKGMTNLLEDFRIPDQKIPDNLIAIDTSKAPLGEHAPSR